MASQTGESTFSKILIGVAVPVLTAAVLYYLNIGGGPKKNEDAEKSKVETGNYNPVNPPEKQTAVITEDDIKQKELELKKKELELKIKKLEEKYSTGSTESTTSHDLSGQWTGDNGLFYSISQNNSQFNMDEYVNLFGTQSVSCHAAGIINGNKVVGTAVGLMGQQFEFNLSILNERSLQFSFMNMTGNYSTITLSR